MRVVVATVATAAMAVQMVVAVATAPMVAVGVTAATAMAVVMAATAAVVVTVATAAAVAVVVISKEGVKESLMEDAAMDTEEAEAVEIGTCTAPTPPSGNSGHCHNSCSSSHSC